MPTKLNLFTSVFTRKTVAPTKTAGHAGTAIYSGIIEEKETNPKLAGSNKYKIYSNMLTNISMVSTGSRYFLNLVAGADWEVDAVNETDEAEDYAEKVRFIMGDMETPWPRVIKRASMYKFYGFSIQEWTAKLNINGDIGFKDIAPRAQHTIESWDTDDTGKVLGMGQRSPQTQEMLYLPRKKTIYMVDDTLNDSPEGLGLLRNLVTATDRLARFEQLEGYGFETDLAGVPVARAPFAELRVLEEEGTITEAERLEIEEPLKQFLTNRIKNPQLGLYLDSAVYRGNDDAQTPSAIRQWDLELLSSTAQSQDAVARTIERLTAEIARMLNVEGMLLGGGKASGSRALGEDKSRNTSLIVDSTLMDLKHSFQKDFIDRLWELNGWPEDMKPKLRPETTQFKDPEAISRVMADLASAGSSMAIDDPADRDIRKLIGVSERPAMSAADLALMGGGGLELGADGLPAPAPTEALSSASNKPLDQVDPNDDNNGK